MVYEKHEDFIKTEEIFIEHWVEKLSKVKLFELKKEKNVYKVWFDSIKINKC